MTGPRRRAAMAVSFVILAAGVGGFLAALGDPFANPEGSLLGKLLHFNQLGALITVGLAAAGLAGAFARKREVVLPVAVGFLLSAAVLLVQTGRDPNWLGGRGNTLSLFLAGGIGLLALALAPDVRHGTGRSAVNSDSPGV